MSNDLRLPRLGISGGHLLKLLRLQYSFLRTTGNFPRCPRVQDLHTALNHPYVCDYKQKLCRQHPEGIQNHENCYVPSIGEAKLDTGNIRGLRASNQASEDEGSLKIYYRR
jgi:hypothetical protein